MTFWRTGSRSISCTSHRRFGPTPAKLSFRVATEAKKEFSRHGTAQPGVMRFGLPCWIGERAFHEIGYVQLVQFCWQPAGPIWSLAAGQLVSGDGMKRRRLHRSRLSVLKVKMDGAGPGDGRNFAVASSPKVETETRN